MHFIKKFFMKFVSNYRQGFATNSSSSHSFVYMKEENSDTGDIESIKNSGNEFGWQDFRLDTLFEKLFYVLTDKIGGLWCPEDEKEEIFEKNFRKFKDEFPEFDKEVFKHAYNGYVDHESKGIINIEEARDPHIVIFGGNDNNINGSQERELATRNKEIDWRATTVEWEDEKNIPEDDEIGQRIIKEKNKRNPY